MHVACCNTGSVVCHVGLPDNVKSNYFYKGMIAEETGMKTDSIDLAYNSIIAENIVVSCKGGDCRSIT